MKARPRPAGPIESALVKACLDLLAVRRIFAWRNSVGAAYNPRGRFVRFGKVGSSDILGVLPGGRLLALEVKRPGGRLTEAQADFLQQINTAGGLAVMIQDVETLERLLPQEARGGRREGPACP